jgi:hypothetical protein
MCVSLKGNLLDTFIYHLIIMFVDRAHVDDVEKELEIYVKHLEGYINALKAEIKCRITNISVLKQANNHLDKDKRDVKVVANVSLFNLFYVICKVICRHTRCLETRSRHSKKNLMNTRLP